MDEGLKVGDVVQLKADQARTGPVIGIEELASGERRYLVFHTGDQSVSYFESQIELVSVVSDRNQLREQIESGSWLGASEFRSRLTAARLANPDNESLYALQSARIKFVPFQFKPLLRFLRADRPRLLIADEVGVGKTIEAGLILRELQTRQDLGNILIVCPKALVSKWRMEMRRFDEDFRPLSSENLRYCLNEAHLDGVWPSQFGKAIVHLELLRMEDYLVQLNELDPPPFFSLTIFDEAHHLRTPGSLSNDLARYLCDVSEAVLFLSATPMQIGSTNLFVLLNLLRPDLFPQEAVFDLIVEPNKNVISAMRHVRSLQPPDSWHLGAADELEKAASTIWGRQTIASDPRLTDWVAPLRAKNVTSRADRIRCLRDLEELHTLAHVMNRTRRRDIGQFTIREPVTVSVPFTDSQEAFYSEVLSFRREMLLLKYDPRVVRLIMDTLERQASSCLPALAVLLDVFVATGRLGGADITDVQEIDLENYAFPTSLLPRIESLRAAARDLSEEDPKLERLREIVVSSQSDEGPGKVLVFSYFIHTLRYLLGNLSQGSLRVALITGATPDEDRERLRDRFRLPRENPDALDVLLSSEVGCEGLDYEFCDRLVNYDIPWNPMKIEQRIGRIDRFGQQSPKVLIYNFVTPGTVEERIYYRCFERIGVFRTTVGDLEEVLGDLVTQLGEVSLNPDLTDEQATAIAEQAADNALRQVEEIRRLEDESENLVGLDELFGLDVDDVLSAGRFVSPTSIRELIEMFLHDRFSAELQADPENSSIVRLRLDKDKRAELRELVRGLPTLDRQTLAFVKWLEGPEATLRFTFEQETALQHRELPFVTPIHPLTRVALSDQSLPVRNFIGHLKATDSGLGVGAHIFVCELWESVALHKETRLVVLSWDLERRQESEEVSESFLDYLEGADSGSENELPDPEVIQSALAALDQRARLKWERALNDLRSRNGILVDRKLATLETYYRSRLERVERDLATITNERIVRMRTSEKERLDRDYLARKADIESRREADVVTTRIAAGVLTIAS